MNSTSAEKEADAREAMWDGNGGVHLPPLPLRGVYIRPTLFMVNGTASRLMDVLYPPGAPMPLFPSDEPAAKWWGYQCPTALARLVSFDYVLHEAFTVAGVGGEDFAPDAASQLQAMLSTGFTEEETIVEPALGAIGEKAGRLLMRSLRENRLMAGARTQAHCCRLGNCLVAGQRVKVVLGSGDGMGLHESVLHTDIEVALRTMNVGDKAMFVLAHYPTSGEDHISAYDSYRPNLLLICINLLDRRIQEPLLSPRLMYKFVVSLPPVEPDEFSPECVCGIIHPFSFFRESMLFSPDSPVSSLHMATEDEIAFTWTGARRALHIAVVMALGNCVVNGLPPPMTVLRDGTLSASPAQLVDAFLLPHRQQQQQSTREYSGGIPTYDDNGMPTDSAAEAFLRLRFFEMPRDGATVNAIVISDSLLTSEPLPPHPIANVLIGSTSLPLWMDLALQSMRPNELDILNVHTGDNDCSFFCNLVSMMREDAVKQFQTLDAAMRHPTHRSGMPQYITPPFPSSGQQEESHEDHNTGDSLPANAHGFAAVGNVSSTSSSSGSTAGACEPSEMVEMEQPMLLPHDFQCRIVLRSFEPAYNITSFFFVDPASALEAVQTLFAETEALALATFSPTDAAQHTTEGENEESASDDMERTPRLKCALAEEIEFQTIPNGCLLRTSAMRGVIKGIQKMNFAILLLTFNVSDQHPRGPPELLHKRRIMLVNLFCYLGYLYRSVGSEVLLESSIDAYSAAIALAPETYRAWFCRGELLRQLGQQNRALRDSLVAEDILQRNMEATGTHIADQELPDEGPAMAVEGIDNFRILQSQGVPNENAAESV